MRRMIPQKFQSWIKRLFGVVDSPADALIRVNGDLQVTGKINGNEIIENMSGYDFSYNENETQIVLNPIYAGVVKNGNKITFVCFGTIKKPEGSSGSVATFDFTIPQSIGNKIYPITFSGSNTRVDTKKVLCANTLTAGADLFMWCDKVNDTTLSFGASINPLTAGVDYLFRYELTLLLSDNLIPQP